MGIGYVGKPCPKCAHVRAASDTGPDWQCPKCGIAYAKFEQARSAPSPGPAFRPAVAGRTASAPAGESSGMAIFAHLSILLWWLAVMGLAMLGFVIAPSVYLAMLLGVVVFLCSMIFPIIAAVKASRGESYYYPRTWHILE